LRAKELRLPADRARRQSEKNPQTEMSQVVCRQRVVDSAARLAPGRENACREKYF
jgi:hypothetical protein